MVLPKRQEESSDNRREGKRATLRLLLLRLRPNASWWLRHGLVLFLAVILVIRFQKKRPYYYGPPVDVFLRQSKDSLDKKLPSCPSALRDASLSSDLAVAVIGSSRADYLLQVLNSLENQSVDNFHVYIFLDFCEKPGCEEVFTLAQDFVAKNPQRYAVRRADQNNGIARMSEWAIDTILEDPQHHWERFLLLEDDHLIGHSYCEAMTMLLSASEHMPKVAVVNGNFADTPQNQSRGELHERRPYFIRHRDEHCHFQIVEPMHANTDVNGHDVWAWATTRTKYQKILPAFRKAFHEAHLDTIPYMDRNRTLIALVMDQYCPGSGYTHWGGQDWLRACMFYHAGMTQKLQPTSRLMTYIGKTGLHMSPEVFQRLGFAPVPVEQVSKDVSRYPDQLCNGVCTFKAVETYDRWAFFRKRRKRSLG